MDQNNYSEHLRTVCSRTRDALNNAGYERLAVFSGEEKIAFRDDWHYPFVANPHFSHWLPLTTNPACWIVYEPNSKPHLIYFQADDYWHQPPADPSGFWVEDFRIDVIQDPAQAKQLLGDLSSTCVITETTDALGMDDWGFGYYTGGR